MGPELGSARAGKWGLPEGHGAAGRGCAALRRVRPACAGSGNMPRNGSLPVGMGDCAAAAGCHVDARRPFPKDLTALACRAGCPVKTGACEGALRCCDDSRRPDPEYPDARDLRGDVLKGGRKIPRVSWPARCPVANPAAPPRPGVWPAGLPGGNGSGAAVGGRDA